MKKRVITLFFAALLGVTAISLLVRPIPLEKRVSRLLGELTKIYNRIDSLDQFMQEKKAIQSCLDQLVDYMVEADQSDSEKNLENGQEAENFEKAFERVLKIEGVREIYRQISQEPFYKLDDYDRKLTSSP